MNKTLLSDVLMIKIQFCKSSILSWNFLKILCSQNKNSCLSRQNSKVHINNKPEKKIRSTQTFAYHSKEKQDKPENQGSPSPGEAQQRGQRDRLLFVSFGFLSGG